MSAQLSPRGLSSRKRSPGDYDPSLKSGETDETCGEVKISWVGRKDVAIMAARESPSPGTRRRLEVCRPAETSLSFRSCSALCNLASSQSEDKC